jgi:hypothetical protein
MELPQFKDFFKKLTLLKEGGNIFQGTRRIKKEEIFATLKQLEKIFNIPFLSNTLGSTGRSPDSGDIDVAMDSSLISKEEFKERAIRFTGNKNDVVKSGISVHIKCPIWSPDGNKTDDYAQLDVMFTSNLEYLKFFYASHETLPLKGKDRNILLSAVAKNKGFKITPNGLVSRQTEQVVTTEPDNIAYLLFGTNSSVKDLQSINNIIKKLVNLYGNDKAKEIISSAEQTIGKALL